MWLLPTTLILMHLTCTLSRSTHLLLFSLLFLLLSPQIPLPHPLGFYPASVWIIFRLEKVVAGDKFPFSHSVQRLSGPVRTYSPHTVIWTVLLLLNTLPTPATQVYNPLSHSDTLLVKFWVCDTVMLPFWMVKLAGGAPGMEHHRFRSSPWSRCVAEDSSLGLENSSEKNSEWELGEMFVGTSSPVPCMERTVAQVLLGEPVPHFLHKVSLSFSWTWWSHNSRARVHSSPGIPMAVLPPSLIQFILQTWIRKLWQFVMWQVMTQAFTRLFIHSFISSHKYLSQAISVLGRGEAAVKKKQSLTL